MRRSLTWGLVLCNLLLPAVGGLSPGSCGSRAASFSALGSESFRRPASPNPPTPTAESGQCPLADIPPTPNPAANMPALIAALKRVGVGSADGELHEIFFGEPSKTKLEQFFRLMYFIQRQKELPTEARPPGITDVLIAARVFKDDSFPRRIQRVDLGLGGKGRPRYRVDFSDEEVRFPLNQGIGFAAWEHGMCQLARELVFYSGFGFSLKESGRNLVVEDFDKVQIFGEFGTRGILDIDLNYVDLERVEFIAGTDEGKVKTRVAKREFAANPHSFLFRWVGRLIPDSSRQRIDW